VLAGQTSTAPYKSFSVTYVHKNPEGRLERTGAGVLDGADSAGRYEEAVERARGHWKTRKKAGHEVTYWQQTDKGWEQKG
jgi:DNA polymerase IIIc chi subunit